MTRFQKACADVKKKSLKEETSQLPTLGGEMEIIYMLRNTALNTTWRNADKAAFDCAAELAEYERRELVDRAHVDRLQAEVGRLNAQLSSEQDRVMATIAQYAKFEARTAELEGLLRRVVKGGFLAFAETDEAMQLEHEILAALAEGKEHG